MTNPGDPVRMDDRGYLHCLSLKRRSPKYCAARQGNIAASHKAVTSRRRLLAHIAGTSQSAKNPNSCAAMVDGDPPGAKDRYAASPCSLADPGKQDDVAHDCFLCTRSAEAPAAFRSPLLNELGKFSVLTQGSFLQPSIGLGLGHFPLREVRATPGYQLLSAARVAPSNARALNACSKRSPSGREIGGRRQAVL